MRLTDSTAVLSSIDVAKVISAVCVVRQVGSKKGRVQGRLGVIEKGLLLDGLNWVRC